MTTPNEEPLDVTAVHADDAVVERLRRSLSPVDAVVWDDDEDAGEDRGYALLRGLQLDITSEALPVAPSLADLLADVGPFVRRRRALGRTAAVAAVTAGVLTLGGAAAAATSAPGDAMYGVRSAVASAVQDVVDAITPSAPIGPDVSAAATPTATISPPGRAVSAAARSISAVRQIEERLFTAERLLAAGRARPALEVLDQATRRLPLVSDPTVRAGLAAKVDALRHEAAALLAVRPKPTGDRPGADPGKEPGRPTPKPSKSAASTRGDDGADTSGRTSRTENEVRAPRAPALPDAAGHRTDR